MAKKIKESFYKGEGTTADDQYYILLRQLEEKYPNSNFNFKKYLEPIFKIAKNKHEFDWCMKDYHRVPIEVLTYYMMEDLTRRAYGRLRVEDERWALGYMRTLEAILNVGTMEDGHREGFRENLDKLETLYQQKFHHKYDGELEQGFCMKDFINGEPEEGYDESLSKRIYRELTEKYGKNNVSLTEERTSSGALTENIAYTWVANALSEDDPEELFDLLCGGSSGYAEDMLRQEVTSWYEDTEEAQEMSDEEFSERVDSISSRISQDVFGIIQKKVLGILKDWSRQLLREILGGNTTNYNLIKITDWGWGDTSITFSRSIVPQVEAWIKRTQRDNPLSFVNYGSEDPIHTCFADSFDDYVRDNGLQFDLGNEMFNAVDHVLSSGKYPLDEGFGTIKFI